MPRSAGGVWIASAVFAGAASAGVALLIALPWSEWLLMMALAPLTSISVLRLFSLLRTRWSQGRSMAAVVAVMALAGLGGAAVLPNPLTRADIQAAIPGAPAPSAHPDAGRLVRT